jgi:tetratricopeptide (TPR) repeat protein
MLLGHIIVKATVIVALTATCANLLAQSLFDADAARSRSTSLSPAERTAARTLFAQGFEAWQAGKFQLASALMSRGLEVDPGEYKAHLLLAQSLERLDDLANARRAYQAVLELAPRTAPENVQAEVALKALAEAAQKAPAETAQSANAIRLLKDEEIAGEWRGSLSGANSGPLIVRFILTGETLSGMMLMSAKSFSIVSASIKEDRITWTQSFLFGNVKWNGTLDRKAATIRGRWVHPFNSDAFELTKAP